MIRVRDWSVKYETHDTRKLKKLTWVPIPNRTDGRAFRRISRMENGAAIFGAWCLILEVASRMPERGILADKDGPLTIFDIADEAGFPVEIFEEAIPVLASEEIKWIDLLDSKSANLPQSPGAPRKSPDEGKGREGKERRSPYIPLAGGSHAPVEKKIRKVATKTTFAASRVSEWAEWRKAVKPDWDDMTARYYFEAAQSWSEENPRKLRANWVRTVEVWARRDEIERRGPFSSQHRRFEALDVPMPVMEKLR